MSNGQVYDGTFVDDKFDSGKGNAKLYLLNMSIYFGQIH